MRNKVYEKVIAATMVMVMSGILMTGCGNAAPESTGTQAEVTAEVADTESIEDDATAQAPAPETAEDYYNGPDNSVYHDANGWSVKYDATKFTVTPENGSVFIVYQGESAGTNVITVTYDVENTGEAAIKKLGESWGSDKTTYSEGPFPGAEDVTGYWATLPPSEDGSGLYETAIGRDYMDGALIFELTGHNGEDDAQNMEVSDQMASVIDSLTFEQ